MGIHIYYIYYIFKIRKSIQLNERTDLCLRTCMYIRSDLAYNTREDLQNDNLEDLWLELLLPKTKPILIGTCYRVPKNSKLTERLENAVARLCSDCDTVNLGDFNYCLIKNKKKKSKTLDTNGFTQLIDTPTCVINNSSSLIVHIYTNETRKIRQSGVIVRN